MWPSFPHFWTFPSCFTELGAAPWTEFGSFPTREHLHSTSRLPSVEVPDLAYFRKIGHDSNCMYSGEIWMPPCSIPVTPRGTESGLQKFRTIWCLELGGWLGCPPDFLPFLFRKDLMLHLTKPHLISIFSPLCYFLCFLIKQEKNHNSGSERQINKSLL